MPDPSPASPAAASPATPGVALAIYAHPNDPDVGCGGTLARWAAAGAAVHVVVCCQGDKGTSDASIVPADLAARRAREVAAAAAALGATGHELLDVPDGDLVNDAALRDRLVEVVRRLRPDVVLCPDPTALLFGDRYWNHRDHRVAGMAALDVVTSEAAMPLYAPNAGPPHRVATVYLSGTLEPDTWVDIGEVVGVKAAAVACHASQVGETSEWLATVLAERAEEAGRDAGVRFAEAFRALHLT